MSMDEDMLAPPLPCSRQLVGNRSCRPDSGPEAPAWRLCARKRLGGYRVLVGRLILAGLVFKSLPGQRHVPGVGVGAGYVQPRPPPGNQDRRGAAEGVEQ